jgi:menaquinol-cytochrome c reductase iron-sulfur subunit
MGRHGVPAPPDPVILRLNPISANDLIVVTRRQLLSRLVIAGSAGVAGLIAIPSFMYTLAPVIGRRHAPFWIEVGPLEGFPRGEVTRANVEVPRADWAASLREKSVYVWHSEEEGPVVYARNCTDLSCPIVHDAGNSWFFCPCHGAIFSTDGQPQKGPANRPLYRFANRTRNGTLEIDLRSLPPIV